MMEQLLKPFSISFLLRSVFAGGFFFISYEIGMAGVKSLLQIDATRLLFVVLPLSLFLGVTIYGFHRALFYPFIEYMFLTSGGKKIRERIPLISDACSDSLIQIWSMSAENGKEIQERAGQASAWADFVHFQYTSALSIGAGAVVCRVNDPSANYQPYCPLIILAIAFITAGLSSDWRLRRIRDKMSAQWNLTPIAVNHFKS